SGFSGTQFVTVAGLTAPVLFAGPNQINIQIPEAAPVGSDQVTVFTSGGNCSRNAQIALIAPGLFSQSQNGTGLASAQVQINGGTPSSTVTNIPINIGDNVVLTLFGTGVEHAGAGQVFVSVGGFGYIGNVSSGGGVDHIAVTLNPFNHINTHGVLQN